MTKTSPVKRSTSNAGSRGKGTYASRACNVCKRKKVKCDEVKPVCGSCETSGRYDECVWTGETARKPRTEAHFEAMRKRTNALERYANILESMLEKCQKEHGGTSLDSQSYLQFRPKDYEDEHGKIVDFGNADDELGHGSDEEDITAEICISAQNLTLDERDLVFYGNAAPFRFANHSVTLPTHVSIIPDVEIDLGARYMLMVEGADLTHYDPNFDWSRYLPQQVALDRKEHDRVLDLLFKFFTSWCMRIVPVLFLRDMYRFLSLPRSQNPPKTSHYSPMLHNALLALATGFSDDPNVRDYKARMSFADEAKRLLESEVQRPNVSVVHALSILGSFHSSNGEQGLGYMYFGIGSRVSQALGLSVDCSSWVNSGLITTHDMYDRNWAYWTTFTQEMCWCLYVGRDFGVSTGGNPPVPFVDAEYDQIPWFHPSSNLSSQPNYLSMTFAATCELMNISRRVSSVLNFLHVSSNRHGVKDEQISRIDLQLHTWKGQLPTEIDITLANKNTSTPHKLLLHLAFWWNFILLHRPFFHRKKRAVHDASSTIDHVKICKRAADNIMDLLGVYRELYTLRYVPVTPVQIVFAAGTVYVLLAVQAATGVRVAKKELETYIPQAELCIQYLTEIGKSWKCASDIADILKSLVATQLRPVLERRSNIKSAARKSGKAIRDPRASGSRLAEDALDESELVPISRSPRLAATTSNFDANASRGQHDNTTPFFPDPSFGFQVSNSSSDYYPSTDIAPDGSNSFPYDLFNMLGQPSFPTSPTHPTDVPYSTSSFISQSSLAPNLIPSPTSMETTGLLAMLGEENMSQVPCAPPFSSMEYTDYAGDPLNDLRNYFPGPDSVLVDDFEWDEVALNSAFIDIA